MQWTAIATASAIPDSLATTVTCRSGAATHQAPEFSQVAEMASVLRIVAPGVTLPWSITSSKGRCLLPRYRSAPCSRPGLYESKENPL